MTIRDVLVAIDGSKGAAARLSCAVELARSHEAHLTALCLAIEPQMPAAMVGFIPSDALECQRQAVMDKAKQAASECDRAIERAGVLGESRIQQVLDGEVATIFVQQARLSDLFILSQWDPEDDSILGSRLPETVIGSGRPVIVLPYIVARQSLGQRVLIAWNGSREASRAVHDALPILQRAASVLVLSVNPDERSDGGTRDAGADLSLHLARHGVKATATRTAPQGLSAGDAILNEVADNGIDLLVMGAYGHSRVREMVLGGVTKHMLEHMTVPVFMSH